MDWFLDSKVDEEGRLENSKCFNLKLVRLDISTNLCPPENEVVTKSGFNKLVVVLASWLFAPPVVSHVSVMSEDGNLVLDNFLAV